MKRMLPVVIAALLVLAPAPQLRAQTSATAELTALLNEFLAGVSRSDPSVHERFWADDLIYTSAAGRRIGKADILKDARPAGGEKPAAAGPSPVYTAEDVRVHEYGDMAVVAFRLVSTTKKPAGPEVAKYLNTGTFAKRGGKWQAVAWQATRLQDAKESPSPAPEPKK